MSAVDKALDKALCYVHLAVVVKEQTTHVCLGLRGFGGEDVGFSAQTPEKSQEDQSGW